MDQATLPRERRCGPCTQCCKVLGIVELNKPGGQRCPNALPAGGCGIYGSHPHSCRTFMCQWLITPEMPHRMRPDLSKVVLGVDDNGERLIAHCDPSNPHAWKREPIYALLKREARAHWGGGFSILAKAGDRVWLIRPNDDQDLGLIDPLSPVSIYQFADGTSKVVIAPPLTREEAAANPRNPPVVEMGH